MRANDKRLSFLFIANRIPRIRESAGDWRSYQLSTALARYGKVYLLPVMHQWASGDARRSLEEHGVKIVLPGFRGSYDFGRLYAKLNCPVVLFERYTCAGPFLAHIPSIRTIVIDAHDLYFQRYLRQQSVLGPANETGINAGAVDHRLELPLYAAANAVVTVSETEAGVLRKRFPSKDIFVIPPCVEAPAKRRPGFEERRDIVFFASFDHPRRNPNVDAARYFLRSIWPSVKQRLPGVRFHIAGHGSRMFEGGTDRSVIVHGAVSDIQELLSACRIFVCPLRFGSGVKKKVFDSLSSGTPVVSTRIGIEGTVLRDRRDVLIAGTPARIASALTGLYTDKDRWQGLSSGGYQTVKRFYSLARMDSYLQPLIKAVVRHNGFKGKTY